MKVYERIKAYLTANGIDPATISKSVGVSQEQLISLLNGEDIMYAKDLKAICLALNVSPELFVEITPSTQKL